MQFGLLSSIIHLCLTQVYSWSLPIRFTNISIGEVHLSTKWKWNKPSQYLALGFLTCNCWQSRLWKWEHWVSPWGKSFSALSWAQCRVKEDWEVWNHHYRSELSTSLCDQLNKYIEDFSLDNSWSCLAATASFIGISKQTKAGCGCDNLT